MRKLFLCIIGFIVSGLLYAQTEQNDGNNDEAIFELSLEDLMQMEVKTATGRAEKLNEAPANVIVLKSEDLQKRGYIELSEVLNDLPGMDIVRPYGDYFVRNYWRGFRNNIGSPYLFMLDGIVTNNLYYNDPEGFLVMPISNIEQIEVVYGPASSVYGANAAMGVINIITKQDMESDGLTANINNTAGFGESEWLSKIADMNMFFKKGKFRMSFTGRYDYTQMNMKYADEYEWTSNKYALDTMLWGSFLDNPNFGGKLTAPRKNYAFDFRTYYGGTELGVQYFHQHNTWGMTYPGDKYLNNAQWLKPEMNVYLRHRADLTEKVSSTSLIRYRQSNVAPGSSSIANYGGESPSLTYEYWQLLNQAIIIKEDFNMSYDYFNASAGFRYSHEDMSKGYDYANGPSIEPDSVDVNSYEYPEIPTFNAKMNNRVLSEEAGLYGNVSLMLSKFNKLPAFIKNHNHQLILGTRFDHNSVYGWANTYRLGYVGVIKKLSFKLLYGEAFQEPPASMLYSSFEGRQASSELSPEISKTIETNIAYTDKNYTVGASIYLVNVENAVIQFEGKAQNVGKREVLGSDAYFRTFIPIGAKSKLDLWAYYSYIQGTEEKYDENDESYTTDIGDLAPHKIKLGADYNFNKRFNIGLYNRWISERKTVKTNPVESIDAFFVTDANFSITNLLNNKLNISFRINNLLDTKYFHPGVASANAGTTPGSWNGNKWNGSAGWYNSLLPQPGRMFYVTLNLKI